MRFPALSSLRVAHRVHSQLKKVKKASGEILGVNVVSIMSTLMSLAAVQVAGGMGS